MKKTYLFGGVLLLCALLIPVISFAAPSAEEAHIDHGQAVAVRTEAELLSMQAGGSYYLDADITLSETVAVEGAVKLCLNGKVLRYENEEKRGSVFHVGEQGALEIYDCSDEIHACIAAENGVWTLTEDTDAANVKKPAGGLIIGGTGEKREIAELKGEYFCGGFACIDGGTLTVYGGNIVGNRADYGGAVYLTGNGTLEIGGGRFSGNLSAERGGAVFTHSGTVLLRAGSISENKAMKNGGGLDISGESILEMRGGFVTGNVSGAWSGGIENFGTFDMYGGTVSGNTAAQDGGGVYNAGSFTMHGGTIRENTAKYGGGVCNDSKMTVHGGEILGNLAQESGGGVYNADKLVMNSGKIASNTAVTSGGGVENDGIFTMYGGSIGGADTTDANMAYLGGGVCVYSGTFTMYGGSIERNTGVDGGGVENEATLVLQGGTVRHNYAAVQGGGITNRGVLALGDGTKVVSNASGTGENEYMGGGIYWIAGENSAVSVSGAVTVTGNTTGGANANLVIFGKGRIALSDVSEETRIGLTLLGGNKNPISGTVLQTADGGDTEALLSLFLSDNGNFSVKPSGAELRLSESNLWLMLGACALVLTVAVLAAVGLCLRKKRKCRRR